MQITIPKKALERALSLPREVADRKSTMPILSNTLIAAGKRGVVHFSATDTYRSVRCSVKGEIEHKGSIAVNARTVFDVVKGLPDGEVKIAVDGAVATISCGKVRFKIPFVEGDSFPTLPEAPNGGHVALNAKNLSKMLALAAPCMSTDEARPHLSCIMFEGEEDRFRIVTTDGHRLHKVEWREQGANAHFLALVPMRGVAELQRLLADIAKNDAATISVSSAGPHIFFSTERATLSVKLAEETFPPYNQVIPAEGKNRNRVTIDRQVIIAALKRINLVANDKSGAVRLRLLEGLITISSENPEVGEGFEEIDVAYSGAGVEAGFNARYFLDALNPLDEAEVCIALGGQLDAALITPVADDNPTNFTGVVMPMRI